MASRPSQPAPRASFDGWLASDVGTAVALAICAVPALAFVTAELPPRAHVALSAGLLAIALLASLRTELRLVVMVLSVCVSARYMWYRATHTLAWEATADGATALLLFGAEAYAFVVLLCGYFQTAITRRHTPAPLDLGRTDLPLVDVFVPSYNEDMDLLSDTLAAALGMDYPNKRVYLLDDGRRPEARALAAQLGCYYLTRDDNRGAKAGNVNAALPRTEGELIAFFDADHVPVRTFLSKTVGFFLEDPKVSLVQTPHYFYNADHFERNLHLDGAVPAEQKLFYHAIQPANDFWNAAFFCGSCAVIRRSAMVGVGGMAEETLTEDAHTALKMHAAGWKSVYLDLPLAAGIATERLAFFVSQRARWARGMAQVFRLDNPLLKPGLSLAQRLTYFSASWHFLFGVPRLLFVLAPPMYLIFGVHPMFADVREVLVFAVPHILLAWTGTAVANRNFRHSFWPEVFEMVLAFPTAIVTTFALLVPKTGVFNVTTKGATAEDQAFDFRRAAPNLALAAFVATGVAATAWRLYGQPLDRATVLVAGAWNIYNLAILTAALAVAWEPPQRRRRHRIPRRYSLRALAAEGGAPIEWAGQTDDLSPAGVRAVLQGEHAVPAVVDVQIAGAGEQTPWIRARVVEARAAEGSTLVRLAFEELTVAQRIGVTHLIFSPPSAWVSDSFAPDNPLRSMAAVLLSPVSAVLRSPKLVRKILGGGKPSPLVTLADAITCPRCAHTITHVRCDFCGADRPSTAPQRPKAGVGISTAVAALGAVAVGITALPMSDLTLFDALVPLDRWSGTTYATRYARLRAAHVDLVRLHGELQGNLDGGEPVEQDWNLRLGRVKRAYAVDRLEFADAGARAAQSEIATALLLLREGADGYRREGASSTTRARVDDAGTALTRAARELGMPQ